MSHFEETMDLISSFGNLEDVDNICKSPDKITGEMKYQINTLATSFVDISKKQRKTPCYR